MQIFYNIFKRILFFKQSSIHRFVQYTFTYNIAYLYILGSSKKKKKKEIQQDDDFWHLTNSGVKLGLISSFKILREIIKYFAEFHALHAHK